MASTEGGAEGEAGPGPGTRARAARRGPGRRGPGPAAAATEAGALHPARTAGVPRLVLRALASPRLLLATLRYLWTVARYFFGSQWAARLRPGRIPLVAVDHPLDGLLPFRPELVGVYLDFIGVWVRGLAWALGRTGRPGYADGARFLHELSDCYREAHGVYARCVSTTRRPERAANAGFGLIYALDPHLYCVPSLHVIVVVQAWLGLRALLSRHGLEEAEAAGVEAIHARAVEIADTIIYVKQHSVNCVPAALFMMERLRPDFGPAEARAFLESMFLGSGVEAAVRAEILDHMRGLLGRFETDAEGRPGDYRDLIVDFLLRYGAEHGSRLA